MPSCTRKGCGKEYSGAEGPCTFHSGAPVFHEGLKSWSCCSDVYKPVLDFDEFMQIPGCSQTDCHTTDQEISSGPQPSAPSLTSMDAKPNDAISVPAPGQEVFTATPAQPMTQPELASASPIVEEEDDLSQTVPAGTTCRRKGCGTKFVSNEVNRLGDGEGTICRYHPAPPIFREGSKGYLCCKRRVLEFEEFLKIEGCKWAAMFSYSSSQRDRKRKNWLIVAWNHYQTVDKVHVSVFAKQADKEHSSIQMSDDQVSLDLALPGSRRFVRTLNLFGPIDPSSSTFQFFGTKVELNLQKKDGRSWTILEKTNQDLGNINLTFGVGGRTGTIGGKNLILDESNKWKV